MSAPILSNPVVKQEISETITKVTPALNCTQVGLLLLNIQWKPIVDGTMGKPSVYMIIAPYDKAKNIISTEKTSLNTVNIEKIATELYKIGRPALAQALQSIYDAIQDIGNDGISSEILSKIRLEEKTSKETQTVFTKNF